MARGFRINSTDKITLGVNKIAPLLNGAAQISVACWAQFDVLRLLANNPRLIYIPVSDGLTGITITTDANRRLRAGARSQSSDGFQTADGCSVLPTGVPVHLGAMLDIAGDAISVFVNGRLERTASVTFGATTWTNGSHTTEVEAIGGFGGDSTVQGKLWDLAVWAIDIKSNGFSQLARNAFPRSVAASDPVAWFQLTGTGTSEIDVIGGSITGTIIGFVPGISTPARLSDVYENLGFNPGWASGANQLLSGGLAA